MKSESRFKVKVTGSKSMVPVENSCHKECTCGIQMSSFVAFYSAYADKTKMSQPIRVGRSSGQNTNLVDDIRIDFAFSQVSLNTFYYHYVRVIALREIFLSRSTK